MPFMGSHRPRKPILAGASSRHESTALSARARRPFTGPSGFARCHMDMRQWGRQFPDSLYRVASAGAIVPFPARTR